MGNNLSITYRPVKSLVPYAKNARTHSAAQVAQIARSIEKFGFTNPILADGANGVIAGHGRLLAAAKLGMAKVPVIALEGLSEADKRALILADNKLALDAGWDEDMLRLELADLTALGGDLDLTGFSTIELADLMGGGGGKTDPDEAPEVPKDPVVRLGDLWHLGAHRLLIGDSTDKAAVGKLLAGVMPLLMVTDPPYGVNYDPTWRDKAERNRMAPARTGKVASDNRSDWREVWRLFPGDIAYVWHGGLHSAVVAESLVSSDFEMRAQIVWNKTVMTIGRSDYHWKHEPCWYAVRKGKVGRWSGDRKQTTVWDIASPLHIMSGSKEVKTEHPTQKPIECMRRPILNNSKRGDAVYEPFAGSGTTLIACEMEKRVCYGMEIDPAYGQVIVERWEAFTGEKALLDGKLPLSAILRTRTRKAK